MGKDAENRAQNETESEGPRHATMGDVAFRVYESIFRGRPILSLGVLGAFLFAWTASKANTSSWQSVFYCLMLASLAGGGAWEGCLACRQHRRKCNDVLAATFDLSEFNPTYWIEVMCLAGGTATSWSGRVRTDNLDYSLPNRPRRFLRDLGKYKTDGTIRVKTCTPLNEVVEQATFTFDLQRKPNQVRLEIGFDMPSHKRKALFDRLKQQIQDIRGVTRLGEAHNRADAQ